MFPIGLGINTLAGPNPMEAVQYTFNTSTGDRDITLDSSIGKNKTPIAAMFATVLGAGFEDAQARISIGFFDGTTSIVVASDSENGVSTSNTVTRGATDECVMLINNAGTVLVEGAGVSLIPNGVRVNIGANIGVESRGICYLFFDNDGAAKVDTFTSHATENSSVTVTPGIAADALITLSPNRTSNQFDDATHNHAIGSIGFAVNGGDQKSIRWLDLDEDSAMDLRNRISPNFGGLTSAGADRGIEFSSYTATQFTATTRGDSGGGTHGYLALEMPNAQFWTGIIDTPISISEPSYAGPGFPVESLIALLTIIETVDAQIIDRTAECFGVAAATEHGVSSVTVASEDNAGTSDTESHYNASTIRAVGADDHNESEVDSFTSLPTGFSLNFNIVHTTAQKWPVLAIGRK